MTSTLFRTRLSASFLGAMILFSLPSARAAEEAVAIVKEFQGGVSIDNGAVDTNRELLPNSIIKTEKDGYIQIQTLPSGSLITVHPDSTLQLGKPKQPGEESLFVKEGKVRAKIKKKSGTNFKIRSTPAVFGVRGTDFLVTVNPIFNDAEVTVFEGQVDVESTFSAQGVKSVVANQWAGAGGRYGKRVTDPMDLPIEAVEALQKTSNDPVWTYHSHRRRSGTSGIRKKSSAPNKSNKAE